MLFATLDAVLLVILGVPSCTLLLRFANTTTVYAPQHITINDVVAGDSYARATGDAGQGSVPGRPAASARPSGLARLLAATPHASAILRALPAACRVFACHDMRGDVWLRAALRRIAQGDPASRELPDAHAAFLSHGRGVRVIPAVCALTPGAVCRRSVMKRHGAARKSTIRIGEG